MVFHSMLYNSVLLFCNREQTKREAYDAEATITEWMLRELYAYFCLNVHESLFSSGAEHWSRKPGVVSSILTGGITFCLLLNLIDFVNHHISYR